MPLYLFTSTDKVRALKTAPTSTPEGAVLASSAEDISEANFPMRRLVDIWNGLPRVTKVERFQNRALAAERIWQALQERMPAPRRSKKCANRQPAKNGASKQDTVLALLRRPQGATVAEMIVATGWQPHSVRGLLAGAFKRRLGLTITATKRDDVRVYRVGKA